MRQAEKLEGFVPGAGETWLLLARLDPNFIELDGYVAVRLGDIKKVEVRGGPASFVGRALAARDQWPPIAVDLNLDDTPELFRVAADLSPLISLYIEAEEPNMCFVGKPVRFTKRKVHLLEVDAEAEWRDDGPSKWAFDEVTRVEFSTHYEEALARVSPPAPE